MQESDSEDEGGRTRHSTPRKSPRRRDGSVSSASGDDDGHDRSPPPSPDSFREIAVSGIVPFPVKYLMRVNSQAAVLKQWMTELLLHTCNNLVELECDAKLSEMRHKGWRAMFCSASYSHTHSTA